MFVCPSPSTTFPRRSRSALAICWLALSVICLISEGTPFLPAGSATLMLSWLQPLSHMPRHACWEALAGTTNCPSIHRPLPDSGLHRSPTCLTCFSWTSLLPPLQRPPGCCCASKHAVFPNTFPSLCVVLPAFGIIDCTPFPCQEMYTLSKLSV
jgi:hypothetical protein